MTSGGIPFFWLGPLGRLVPLASPETDIDRTDALIGARHRSMNGTSTLDVRGFRRTWTLETTYLHADDLSYLQSCYRQVIPDPLRLIDPVSKNRLSTSTSAAGTHPGWPGSRENWKATTGAVIARVGDGVPITYDAGDTRTVTYTPRRYMLWQSGGAGDLFAETRYSGGVTHTADAAPLLGGETVTLSAFLRVTEGPGTASLALHPVTGADTLDTPAVSSTVHADTWTRASVTYTVPNAGVSGCGVSVRADGNALIEVTGVQLEQNSTPTSWVLGTGCPQVLLVELEETSPIYPYVSATLTLTET